MKATELLSSLPSGWHVVPVKAACYFTVSNVDKHSLEDEIPVRLCNYTDVYKNDRLIQNLVGDTSHVDIVAPGVPTKYMVRSIDIYDLEGPESNHVTEKASYAPPDLTLAVIAGGYAVEGSGRLVNLSWQPIPGVGKYALYRDGELLAKQSEPLYEEKDLEWNTTYVYKINSIDSDDLEGVFKNIVLLKRPVSLAILPSSAAS